MEKEYVPFGPEWEKEVKKNSKDVIVSMFRKAAMTVQELRDKQSQPSPSSGEIKGAEDVISEAQKATLSLYEREHSDLIQPCDLIDRFKLNAYMAQDIYEFIQEKYESQFTGGRGDSHVPCTCIKSGGQVFCENSCKAANKEDANRLVKEMFDELIHAGRDMAPLPHRREGITFRSFASVVCWIVW